MRLLQKNYIKKVALNIPCLFLRKQSHFIMRVLRIIEKTFFFSVNVTKSAGNCGFGHIY